MNDPTTISALVSWAHRNSDWTSDQAARWKADVLEFTDLLRRNGIDAQVDLYHQHEGINWIHWGPRLIAESDRTLVVMSDAWADAWLGTNDPTRNAGAAAEANSLHSIFNRNQQEFYERVRIILLSGHTRSTIPAGLDGVTSYQIDQIDNPGIEGLLRDLTGQPRYPQPPLGRPPRLDQHPDQPPPSPPESAPAAQTASLIHEPLATPIALTPRSSWDRRYDDTAAVTVHITPMPQTSVSARQFTELSSTIADRFRASAAVPASAGLDVATTSDAVQVSIQPERRSWNAIDHGQLLGLRAARSGQISVWHSLPSDQMGAVLDATALRAHIESCLRVAHTTYDIGARVAIGIEVGPSTRINRDPVAHLGRSNASYPHLGRAPLLVEPDEVIATTSFADAIDKLAADLSAVTIQAWDHP